MHALHLYETCSVDDLYNRSTRLVVCMSRKHGLQYSGHGWWGCNKLMLIVTLMDHAKTIQSSFSPIQLIGYMYLYNLPRLLDFEIWLFSWWQHRQRTHRPTNCFTPAYARRVFMMLSVFALSGWLWAWSSRLWAWGWGVHLSPPSPLGYALGYAPGCTSIKLCSRIFCDDIKPDWRYATTCISCSNYPACMCKGIGRVIVVVIVVDTRVAKSGNLGIWASCKHNKCRIWWNWLQYAQNRVAGPTSVTNSVF